jgi:hypothetical protein
MNTTVKAGAATLQAASEGFSKALEGAKGFEGTVCLCKLQSYPLSLLKKTAPAGGKVSVSILMGL